MEQVLCVQSCLSSPLWFCPVPSPSCSSDFSYPSSSARALSSSSSQLWSAGGDFRLRASWREECRAPKAHTLRTVPAACATEGKGEEDVGLGRRQACLGMASVVLAGVGLSMGFDAAVAREVEVGAYLPAYVEDPRFVQFRASTKDTPALRAGNVQPYGFVLPPTWKQERVANILSGNYCQPKCAEPWVEVKFADAKQGAIQVVAAPMVRLTNKPNATIEEIGSPEKILAALGPFVTGNSFDPEEVTETSVQRRGDQTYYSYQLETPYAKTGAHNLATATAKGSVVMLFVVSANDAQWLSSEKLLRSIVDSFGV